MSKQVIIINKPVGKTPLEMVKLFKEKYPEYANTVVSYAGRLDPMASGVLVLLIGEENKKRQNYLHLDKTYEVEILFGFETDTYDILGKVTKVSNVSQVPKEKIDRELKRFIGKSEQEYPPYSSKTVLGKPLFWWARNNKLDEITIPKRVMEIFDIVYCSERAVSGKEIGVDIEKKIEKISGDFRQEAIFKLWRDTFDEDTVYSIVKILVHCSSGTYMRTLVHELGNKLGSCAVAYSIYRTQVGGYKITDAIKV